ncbi:MAG: hypothetical protein KKG60_00350 [Nanoarchaeota archaeon]|nr:hypothetical protein [Nanoarchaeota archaeon]
MTMIKIGYRQECRQEQTLRIEQKQKVNMRCLARLEYLLLLNKRLKHRVFPGALRGWEGLQSAHKVLVDRNSSGVLIGGLSEKLWNPEVNKEDLYNSKDVDVLVLDKSFELSKKFEFGIDWWTPKSERITFRLGGGKVEYIKCEWLENGHGIPLSFGVDKKHPLDPGLYIPNREWIVRMREYESDAHIDYGRVEVNFDGDTFEKFRDLVRGRMKDNLPDFIYQEFQGHIPLPECCLDDSIDYPAELIKFDLKILRGINGFKGNWF